MPDDITTAEAASIGARVAIDQMQSREKTLRRLLIRYGRHIDSCAAHDYRPCTCGWSEVVSLVEKDARDA